MATTSLAAALLAELDEASLDILAERLASRLLARLAQTQSAATAPWLNAEDAARYMAAAMTAPWRRAPTRPCRRPTARPVATPQGARRAQPSGHQKRRWLA